MADESIQNTAARELIQLVATLLLIVAVVLGLTYVIGGSLIDLYGLLL